MFNQNNISQTDIWKSKAEGNNLICDFDYSLYSISRFFPFSNP